MKNKKQSKRAATYYRTATAKQSGDLIAIQKNQCQKWAKQNGYEIVGEYQDVGASGLKLNNRKALIDAIVRCQNKANPIDVLIVTDMDRLSRNTVELLFIKSQIDLNGTKIIAVNQQTTNNFAAGQLFESVIASANAFSRTMERRSHEKSSNL